MIARFWFLTFCSVASSSYADDRPYFWDTTLDRSYGYFEIDFLRQDFTYSSRSTNNSSIPTQQIKMEADVDAFRFISPEANGWTLDLQSSKTSGDSSQSKKSVLLSRYFTEARFDYQYTNIVRSAPSSSYDFSLHNFTYNTDPEGEINYRLGFGLINNSNIINDGINGFNAGVRFEKDGPEYSRLLDINISRSPSSVQSGTVIEKWWDTSIYVGGHILTKLGTWRTGPALSSQIRQDSRSPDIYSLSWIALYTSTAQEFKAELTTGLQTGVDIIGTNRGDATGETLTLSYVRELPSNFFARASLSKTLSNQNFTSTQTGTTVRQETDKDSIRFSIIRRF